MAYRPLSKDSLANKAFALELQRHLAKTLEASSSKDEFKRVETPEETFARIRSTPFSPCLLSPLPADEIMLPEYLAGNGRKLKKNCLGVETLISKDSLANKAFALELQGHLETLEALSSKDEFKRVETPEETFARIRSTPFSPCLLSPLPADEIMLPEYLAGNGRKLKKKNCLGVETLISKDSLANKAFALELQRHLARTLEASSSKDEFKRVETPEETFARLRSTPFSLGLLSPLPVDEMYLPKYLVGNGRKLEKKNCLGVETREEFLARIRSTPFSNDLCYDPPVDSRAAKILVGNGRKLKKKKKKKNCVGISNAKKKNKVARSTKCKKQRAIKV